MRAAGGEFDKAAADFNAVLAMLPGELAPKLAIAATAELRDARDDAARYYETVWRTDHSKVSAAFGLARQRARAETGRTRSRRWTRSTPSQRISRRRRGRDRDLLDGRAPEDIDEQTLLDAGSAPRH